MAQVKDAEWLRGTSYPGRGLAVGWSATGSAVQLYWLMGRSAGSRNRYLVQQADAIRTAVADPEIGAGDQSLTLYAPLRWHGPAQVVSNGDQTDTIIAGLRDGGDFATAFATRDVEPDQPHYTPRIAGLIDTTSAGRYELAIIKTTDNDPAQVTMQHFLYRAARPGWGHCITTYEGDGTPLPSFRGEPFPLQLAGDAEAAVAQLWALLDRDHRVAAAARFVATDGSRAQVAIINRFGTDSGPAAPR